jgi:hypothetical protein
MSGAERIRRFRERRAAERPTVNLRDADSELDAAKRKIAMLEAKIASLTAAAKPGSAEPEITIDMLSMSDRKKAEKYRQRLNRDFEWKLEQRWRPEMLRRTEELRQHLQQRTKEVDELEKLWMDRLNTKGGPGNKGVMERAMYRQVLARLHPDAGGKAALFDAFKQLEDRLIPAKDVLDERAKRKRK